MHSLLRIIGVVFALFGVLSVMWAFGGAILGLFIGGSTEITSSSGLVRFIGTRAGIGVLAIGCAVFFWRLSSAGARRDTRR